MIIRGARRVRWQDAQVLRLKDLAENHRSPLDHVSEFSELELARFATKSPDSPK